MRDPRRIQQAIYYLNKIWMKQPDIRFNQLIHNLQWEFDQAHNGKCSEELYRREPNVEGSYIFHKADVVDLFHVEDDKFIAFLKAKTNLLYPEEEL